MLKKTLLLFFTLQCIQGFNQQKIKKTTVQELTLESAVLSYYNGLFPRTLSNLKWTTNNTISFRNDSILFFQKPTASSAKSKYNTSYLNKIDSSISKMPYFNTVSKDYLTFLNGNKFTKIDINARSFSVVKLSKNAQNNQISPNQKQVAYTINNNLYLANNEDSIIPITEIKNPNIVSGQAIHRYDDIT